MPELEINLDALAHNLRLVRHREQAWGFRFLPVLKMVASHPEIVSFLRRQGYEVEGATLLLEGNADGAGDAARAAAVLGIPHRTVELRETFRREVMDVFAAEYRAGRTPNPCVLCNRAVKFGAMLRYALDNGFDAVATGHYARIREENGRFLLEAVPSKKDQSYMLYRLPQAWLSRLRFLLGTFADKEAVRSKAREYGL